MSSIEYDPELPFVVVIREDHGDDVILARCSTWDYANQLAKAGTRLREVVDTTPKPKIPENAEFITWQMNGANEVAIFADFNPLRPWEWAGMYFSKEDLLKETGDAEVTVLVRKDET